MVKSAKSTLVILHRFEGGELLGGAAFNDESRTRTAALLNKLWDGQAIKRLGELEEILERERHNGMVTKLVRQARRGY